SAWDKSQLQKRYKDIFMPLSGVPQGVGKGWAGAAHRPSCPRAPPRSPFNAPVECTVECTLECTLGAAAVPGDTPSMTTNENDNDSFGIWEGEVAVELPKAFDAGLYYIGRIRTPWKSRKDCPKNACESDAVCTIEVDPRWAQALKDVETCSHVV